MMYGSSKEEKYRISFTQHWSNLRRCSHARVIDWKCGWRCARAMRVAVRKRGKRRIRAENTSLFHPDARFMLYTKSCLQQSRRAPSGFDCMIASFIKLGRARYFKFMLSDNCTHVRPTGTKCCGQHDGIMKKSSWLAALRRDLVGFSSPPRARAAFPKWF